ncbi:hypothetical protein F5888DRAFT_1805358 [Russula emetica]|nr:hypothetical protein F5888DRAFT_1805358 [Russula emetica]
MQANPPCELYRVSRAQVNEVYLNGSGTQNHSPYQSEAMENVYYWYDGNVPYCTDATAWQPLDDNFIHMNVPGYFYVDNYGVTHQLVNIRHNSHVGFQESVPHSYAPQYREPHYTNPSDRTRVFNNLASPCSTVTSPCTSLSSIAWSDSVSSPTPHSQHHHSQSDHSDDAIISGTHLHLNLPLLPGGLSSVTSATSSPTPPHSRGPARQLEHSNDAISSESQLQLALPPYPPPSIPVIPQMASPVYDQPQQQREDQDQDQDQQPPDAPVPNTPPSGPSSPALDSTSPQDLVGRRAPKRRRVTRSVQPLACYFCRGRKIACGPPTNSSSGDRTCEYVVRRLQLFL